MLSGIAIEKQSAGNATDAETTSPGSYLKVFTLDDLKAPFNSLWRFINSAIAFFVSCSGLGVFFSTTTSSGAESLGSDDDDDDDDDDDEEVKKRTERRRCSRLQFTLCSLCNLPSIFFACENNLKTKEEVCSIFVK